MATLPIIADTYRCALNWRHTNGQTAANVIHIRKAASTAAAVAAGIDANVTAAMWQPLSNGASVQEVRVTPLDGSTATTILAVTGAKWTGGTAGDYTPAAAVLISLRTPFRGRSYRGRLFLPYLTETYQSNGSLDATARSNAQTAWDTFYSALNAGGFLWVVASYKLAIANSATARIVESAIATMRPRQSRLR